MVGNFKGDVFLQGVIDTSIRKLTEAHSQLGFAMLVAGDKLI